MYKAEILADSISDREHRLTSFLLTYPRMIHSELMTHSMLVRNSESSRARPVKKNITDVDQNPFIPEVFGKNQPGMQWERALDEGEDAEARATWQFAAGDAIAAANSLAELDVHKSYANRVLEPFKFHTAIFSGTDWSNFFALRTHPDAQAEFRKLALMMQEVMEASEPKHLSSFQYHVPFVTDEEIDAEALTHPDPWVDWDLWRKVSAGRCARVSYLTHDGKRDLTADQELAERLVKSGHLSPLAHQARPFNDSEWDVIWGAQDAIPYDEFGQRLIRNLEYCAQYRGWWQARASIPNEHDFGLVMEGMK